MRYLKQLDGNPQDMASEVLRCNWKDRVKSNALDVDDAISSVVPKPASFFTIG